MGDRVQLTSRVLIQGLCDLLTYCFGTIQVLELVKVDPVVLQTTAAVLGSNAAPETVQVLVVRDMPLPGSLEISLLADVLLSNGT
jgi:hypothetical protein